MIEPKLRFKADDGSQFPDWEEKTFNDVADYKKGPFGSALKKEIFVPKSNDTVKVYEQQNAISKDWKLERYFVTNEYFQSKMKSFAVSGGDIIVSCAGTIGEMYELPHDAEEGIINQALMRVRIKKSVINSMIFRCVFDKMISTEGVKISNGSALKNIPPFADMKKQSVFVPSLPEQQKIAEFLSTIDTVIAKQKETVSAWEERKKGMMQKLFSQEVRFKADDGSDFPDWDEKKLGEVFTERTERSKGGESLLSVTIAQGIVKQSETDKRNIASENKSNYKIVKKNDLAYNTMRMWQGAEGVSEYDGIVSPAYTVITALGGNNSYFFETMFKQTFMLQVFQRYSQGLTSDTWNLKFPAFSEIKCQIPCEDEQNKIVECVAVLYEVIEKQKATLAAWEELKKGLLQQMFV